MAGFVSSGFFSNSSNVSGIGGRDFLRYLLLPSIMLDCMLDCQVPLGLFGKFDMLGGRGRSFKLSRVLNGRLAPTVSGAELLRSDPLFKKGGLPRPKSTWSTGRGRGGGGDEDGRSLFSIELDFLRLAAIDSFLKKPGLPSFAFSSIVGLTSAEETASAKLGGD